LRKLILIVFAFASMVTSTFAEDFVDDVMILKAYRNNCDPVILEEMSAIDHAALAEGLDTWSVAFYREIEKRRKDYVSSTPSFGTPKWCGTAKQQIDATTQHAVRDFGVANF
jgi:hypothetical protein